MSCCKYSSEFISSNKTSIDNVFINDFMLQAPEKCVKVYLYGLYKCNNPDSLDNNILDIAKQLNYTPEDIISAFMYWEDLNLIQILSREPLEVRYLPIKNGSLHIKKFNVEKYKAFNTKAQELITGRMISPSEYQEYYYLIENKHVESDALIMIIKYCVDKKGGNISSNYILTVAKNWIFDGILTCAQVEERLLELERNSEDIQMVLKALGIRRKASEDEYSMYLAWKNDMEMSQEIILHIARIAKSKGAGFIKLDNLINKCYSLNLTSVLEIDDYFNNLDNMYELAKQVCKNLGIRYDNLEIIVDTYIVPWINLGFEPDALTKIANYCLKAGTKTIDGMDGRVNQMFKLGLLTAKAIEDYIIDLGKNDEKIEAILQALGLDRCVNSTDRYFYKTWTQVWEIDEELMNYAIELSIGKSMPMQYINKILSTYHTKSITNVDDAKKLDFAKSAPNKSNNKGDCENAKGKEYSKRQLNSLISNLFEVEI